MNAHTKDIGDQILSESNLVSGFGGKDDWALYIGTLPHLPNRVVCLIDSPGMVDQFLDVDHTFRREGLQVKIRGEGYEETVGKVLEIEDFLISKLSFVTGGVHYLGIVAYGSPLYLGQDERGRHGFSSNFVVMRQQEV